MNDITVLGIFVADISFLGNKIPATGETILGDSYNIGPVSYTHLTLPTKA